MIGNLPFNYYQKSTRNGKIFLIIIYNEMTDTISFSHLYNWCMCKLNKIIFRLLASFSPSFHLELYCPSSVLRKLNTVIFVYCSHNLPLISSGIALSVRLFICIIACMHGRVSFANFWDWWNSQVLLQESGDVITMERCRVVMRNVLQWSIQVSVFEGCSINVEIYFSVQDGFLG